MLTADLWQLNLFMDARPISVDLHSMGSPNIPVLKPYVSFVVSIGTKLYTCKQFCHCDVLQQSAELFN